MTKQNQSANNKNSKGESTEHETCSELAAEVADLLLNCPDSNKQQIDDINDGEAIKAEQVTNCATNEPVDEDADESDARYRDIDRERAQAEEMLTTLDDVAIEDVNTSNTIRASATPTAKEEQYQRDHQRGFNPITHEAATSKEVTSDIEQEHLQDTEIEQTSHGHKKRKSGLLGQLMRKVAFIVREALITQQQQQSAEHSVEHKHVAEQQRNVSLMQRISKMLSLGKGLDQNGVMQGSMLAGHQKGAGVETSPADFFDLDKTVNVIKAESIVGSMHDERDQQVGQQSQLSVNDADLGNLSPDSTPPTELGLQGPDMGAER